MSLNHFFGGATVYRLRSRESGRRYTGVTRQSVLARLVNHNSGGVPTTRCHRPWELEAAFWFQNESLAFAFERYLKSGSGHAFAKRHF